MVLYIYYSYMNDNIWIHDCIYTPIRGVNSDKTNVIQDSGFRQDDYYQDIDVMEKSKQSEDKKRIKATGNNLLIIVKMEVQEDLSLNV